MDPCHCGADCMLMSPDRLQDRLAIVCSGCGYIHADTVQSSLFDFESGDHQHE